ncbi:MAG: hypothetical protein WHT29_00540 [Bacteroidales bacterium]
MAEKMDVKGTSVRSVVEFIDKFYPTKKQDWLNALPEESRKIMSGFLFTNNWYPIKESLITPMQAISKLFFGGDDVKTARTMGRYSADTALSGVYRFFIQFGSPRYIIEKASKIFATYFQPSELTVLNVEKNGLVLHITVFPESATILEENIAGWMERALEKSGCKNVTVNITRSIAKGDKLIEYVIRWE